MMKPFIALIFVLAAIIFFLMVAMTIYWARIQLKYFKLLRYLRTTYPNKFRFDLLSLTMAARLDMLVQANKENLYDANAEAVRGKLRNDLRSPFLERAMSAVFVMIGLMVVVAAICSRQWIVFVALIPVALVGWGFVALSHVVKKDFASKVG